MPSSSPNSKQALTLLAPLVLVGALVLLIPMFDFQQCTRKCRLHFSQEQSMADRLYDRSVTGVRNFFAAVPGFGRGDTCECSSADTGQSLGEPIARLYSRFMPGYPYIWRDPRVCGVDGVEYSTAAAAREAGVKVINCGPCGTCSTVHDVARYREFDKPLTKMLSVCAIVYLFAGETAARVCLDATVGLTERCADRFIDNYGCVPAIVFFETPRSPLRLTPRPLRPKRMQRNATYRTTQHSCVISHCIGPCLFKGGNPLAGSPNTENESGEELNECFLCDEMHCSPVFIATAGANRRTSGTQTDVVRPAREICGEVNAL